MTITLTVAGRIATVEADGHVVAGNTYPVTLSLDSEWTGSLYLRVRFGSLYYDIPFASSAASVDVQMPVGYPEVGIGVFSEALEICTNEARVRLLRSILEQGVSVVEFDTDLYTQWQNEVSELVCDDAFDSTSDRPVKNSVITAWKNTVPLDSALVHKTGNETIDGVKSFTSHLGVYKNFNHFSDADYQSTGIFKCQEVYYDRKNNADSMLAHVFFYRGSAGGKPYESQATRLYKPDRSGYTGFELRAYQDHMEATIEPYYPVDGSGNPQPLPSTVLMSSGNIAVDPRIVHTTGNETVAGNKTFTATMNIKGTAQLVPRTVYDSGTQSTYYGWKGRISIIDHKDGAESTVGDILCTSVQTYGEVSMRAYKPDRTAYSELRLRHYADFQSLLIPSHYPVDGSGNPTAPAEGEAMSSGMVAVDPRIVHTTGAETIAGYKTFSQSTKFNGAVECFNMGRKGYVYPSDANARYEIARTASDISDFYADVTVQNTALEWFSARLYVSNGSAMKAVANGKKVGDVALTIGACVDPTTGEHIVWFKSSGRNNHMASIQAYNRFGGAIPVTMQSSLVAYTPASEPTVEASVTGEN